MKQSVNVIVSAFAIQRLLTVVTKAHAGQRHEVITTEVSNVTVSERYPYLCVCVCAHVHAHPFINSFTLP